MRTIGPGLAAHLASGVTTLATCWRITRVDGAVFRFTDHDRDLLVDGETYRASTGYSRTAVASDADLAVDNLDVEAVFNAEEIAEADLRAGRFDQAEVRVFLVNWEDPAQGTLKLRRGWFGEVMLGEQGSFRTELRGMTQPLQQRVGELYGPECRADLGDHRCGVPIEPPEVVRQQAYAVGDVVRVRTAPDAAGAFAFEDRIYRCVVAGTTSAVQPVYDTTIATETTDGTTAFVAHESWTRAGTVLSVESRTVFTAAITDPRAVDGWLTGGVLTFETGANAGRSMEIKGWTQGTGRIELYLPLGYAIAVGDVFRIHPGCDKRLDTCIDRFANVLNFRGEPYIPGQDLLMSFPDAR